MPKDNDFMEVLPVCNFCGKNENQASFLVTASENAICEDCVKQCLGTIEASKKQNARKTKHKYENFIPPEIHNFIDQYVIGQEWAKMILATAVYEHYKRINSNTINNDVELEKSNILLVGPTGCGKTLLVKTLSRLLDVPLAISDATTLTQAGYVGEDVENVLLRLIQEADYDIARAEKGIVYIDEIDKITRKSEGRSLTRDVSGEGVQQALLKLVEGSVVNVPAQGGRKLPTSGYIPIDTSNILFIVGGAFEGLNKIIKKRIQTKSQIGFGSDHISKKEREEASFNLLKQILPNDVIKYGMIPELVGRLPITVALQELDLDDLVRVLKEPKNSIIKQKIRSFELDKLKLSFTDEALKEIAIEAVQRKVGARGLRTIVENIIMPIQYRFFADKMKLKEITIDDSLVKEALVMSQEGRFGSPINVEKSKKTTKKPKKKQVA